MLCFKIKSTYLVALLYSLLFARVSDRFEAFSASYRYFGVPLLGDTLVFLLTVQHQNSANSPKTLQNGLRRGQTTKNTTRQ